MCWKSFNTLEWKTCIKWSHTWKHAD